MDGKSLRGSVWRGFSGSLRIVYASHILSSLGVSRAKARGSGLEGFQDLLLCRGAVGKGMDR